MTCKDCIHRELCADYVSALAEIQNADVEYISQWLDEIEGRKNQTDNACENFKDRSRFVELPRKVGDTVYRPRYSQLSEQWEIDEWVVTEISFVNYHVGYLFDKNGNWAVGNKENRIEFHLTLSDNTKLYKEALVRPICVPLADLDDLFFITYEEAEQALKEREENEN